MFTRRASALPALAVIMSVSGVFILDTPPLRAVGSGPFGKIALIGEFEDGPFNVPTDMVQATDQATKFGLLGYNYPGKKYQYPCARRSGGNEDWNGNGWLHSARLVFGGGLTLCRVDTSIGQVTLTPRAYVPLAIKPPFALDAGQTLIVTPNGGGAVTVTFAATAASLTAASGTVYTGIAAGETVRVAFDDGSLVDVVFQPGDNSIAGVVARFNATFGQVIASNVGGLLKLTSLRKGSGSKVTVQASTTATNLGLAAGSTAVAGAGDAVDIAATTFAELKTKVEATSALLAVTLGADGYPRIVSKLGGTGTVLIGNGTANAALGLVQGSTATTAALAADVTVSAGLRVTAGTDVSRVVTMQTVTGVKGSTGAINVKVRPAIDDGSYAGQASGTMTTLEDKPGDLEWSVSNPGALTAALTAAQLDSAYLAAIAACKGIGNPTTKTISGIVSARTSNAIRAALPANAIDTSANGHQGRRAFICPPNGTSASTALGTTPPGVGAYRAEEVAYVCGAVRCYYQELVDGGHAADGVAVRHPDVMMASRWGSLTPGYNPGQLPEDPSLRWSPSIFLGLEASAAGWDLSTYAAFKRAGICGTFFDAQNGITFEQGITSVDPQVDPARVDIARKTLADDIGDGFAAFLLPQAKRQGTETRREVQRAAMEGNLETRLDDTVEEYEVSLVANPTPHLVQWDIAVSQIGSDDVILLGLSVGIDAVKIKRS